MNLDIRPAAAEQCYDLYEGDERIGEIRHVPAAEEWGELNPEGWDVELWSPMGTGKTWGSYADSLEEAKADARASYEDLVAERRELRKGARPRTISTPMGGQRRR